MLASAVYFAMAYVINHSGKALDWTLADPGRNMVAVLADASSAGFGRFYRTCCPVPRSAGRFRQRVPKPPPSPC